MANWRVVCLAALLLAAFHSIGLTAETPTKLKLIDHGMIWDRAKDNEFTDLTWFRGKFYVCFREATEHGVDGDGKVRIIRSAGGSDVKIADWTWESVALLDYENPKYDNWDVRDPQLTVTPDDRLMLNAAAAPLAAPGERQSLAWFSDGKGENWRDGPHEIGDYNWWIWRVAWHPNGTIYGAAYKAQQNRLYHGNYRPGGKKPLDLHVHVPSLLPKNSSTETALLFCRDGNRKAVALVRRGDEVYGRSWVGTSGGDYKAWTFRRLDKLGKCEVGGQEMIELPGGDILAATRYNNTRTSLCRLDPEAGKLVEAIELPYGAHGGYCGLFLHDGFLWISYHGGETRTWRKIYLAKISIPDSQETIH